MTGITIASAIADVEFSQTCIKSETCIEANPVMPSSRWKAYAVQAPILALANLMAWKCFKKGHKHWWKPQVGVSAVHGVWAGVAFSF
jgi:hypothetical protein